MTTPTSQPHAPAPLPPLPPLAMDARRAHLTQLEQITDGLAAGVRALRLGLSLLRALDEAEDTDGQDAASTMLGTTQAGGNATFDDPDEP